MTVSDKNQTSIKNPPVKKKKKKGIKKTSQFKSPSDQISPNTKKHINNNFSTNCEDIFFSNQFNFTYSA